MVRYNGENLAESVESCVEWAFSLVGVSLIFDSKDTVLTPIRNVISQAIPRGIMITLSTF